MKRIQLLFFLIFVILQGCNEDREEQNIQEEKKQVEKKKEVKAEEVRYTRDELRQGIEELARGYGLPAEVKDNDGSYSTDELAKNMDELAEEYNQSLSDTQGEKESSLAEPNEFTEKLRELAQWYNLDWGESTDEEKSAPPTVERSPDREEADKNQEPVQNIPDKRFDQGDSSSAKMMEKRPNQITEGSESGGGSKQKLEKPIEQKLSLPKATDPSPNQPIAMQEAPVESDTKDENFVENIFNIAPKEKELSDEIKEKEKEFGLLDLNEELWTGHGRQNTIPLTYEELKGKYPESFFTRGEHGKERIALTFDDGPDLTYTPQILGILREHGVKATFFLIGERAEAHPDMVKQIIQEGHEVGIHSYQHLYLPKLDESRFEQQIRRMEEVLHSLGADTKLFRPPFGSISSRQAEFMINKRYKIIHWDVDSQDWKGNLGKKEIEGNVLGLVEPGSIILCHSAGGNGLELSGTVEALPGIIEQLKKKDMTFVKVSELVE